MFRDFFAITVYFIFFKLNFIPFVRCEVGMPVAPVKKENTSPVLSAVEQDFLHRMSDATAKKNHNL